MTTQMTPIIKNPSALDEMQKSLANLSSLLAGTQSVYASLAQTLQTLEPMREAMRHHAEFARSMRLRMDSLTKVGATAQAALGCSAWTESFSRMQRWSDNLPNFPKAGNGGDGKSPFEELLYEQMTRTARARVVLPDNARGNKIRLRCSQPVGDMEVEVKRISDSESHILLRLDFCDSKSD